MAEIEPKDVLETGFKALFGPVQDLFLKLTGPAAEEYGLMWADSLKLRRTKRLVSGLAKTKNMLEEARFEAQIVPDKLLLPIFEGMSFEDGEDLRTMWAALLANAARPVPKDGETVRPVFVAILQQMAPDEAAVLNWIYDKAQPGLKDFKEPITEAELLLAYAGLGFGVGAPNPPTGLPWAAAHAWQFGGCLNSLEARQLIRTRTDVVNVGYAGQYYSLTFLGQHFVDACRPPETKK